jgi:hypothetical protein
MLVRPGFGLIAPALSGARPGLQAAAVTNQQRLGLRLVGQQQLRQGLAVHALVRSLASQGATAQLVARNKVAQGVLGQIAASRTEMQGALPNARSAALRAIAQQRISQGLASQEIARKLINRARAVQLLEQNKMMQAFKAHAAASRSARPGLLGSGSPSLLHAKAAGFI